MSTVTYIEDLRLAIIGKMLRDYGFVIIGLGIYYDIFVLVFAGIISIFIGNIIHELGE